MGQKNTKLRAHPEVKLEISRALGEQYGTQSVEALLAAGLYVVPDEGQMQHDPRHSPSVQVPAHVKALYSDAKKKGAELIDSLPLNQLLEGGASVDDGESDKSRPIPAFDRAKHLLAISVAALLNNNLASATERWCRTDEDKRRPALLPTDDSLLILPHKDSEGSRSEDCEEPQPKRRAQRNAVLAVSDPALINAWSLFLYSKDVDDEHLEGLFMREQLKRFDAYANMKTVDLARGFIRAKLLPEHKKLRELSILAFKDYSVSMNLTHIEDESLRKFMDEFGEAIVKHTLEVLGSYPMNIGTIVIEEKIKERFGQYLWEKHGFDTMFRKKM